jgi:hypothetical protein
MTPNLVKLLRATCLLAYGLSLFIFYRVQPMPGKAYDALCAAQGVTYLSSVRELLTTFAILFAVTLGARSTTLIIVNVFVSALTLLAAIRLLSSGSNMSYECFYADHTSALEYFGFGVGIASGMLTLFLGIDLVFWAVKNLTSVRRKKDF